jgi:hypothetical protein
MISYTFINYPETSVLIGAAETVWASSQTKITIQLPISENFIKRMHSYFSEGIESIFITDSDMRHIKKHHSKNEENRGQINVTPKDFRLMPLIIHEFDSVEMTDSDKLGNRRFIFSKKIEGTDYAAAIERGKRKMEVRSFWRKKVSGASC